MYIILYTYTHTDILTALPCNLLILLHIEADSLFVNCDFLEQEGTPGDNAI